MEIWERQKDESAKAYQWFCRYLDYGVDRSFMKVRKKYGESSISMRLFERWSAQHQWIKRCCRYDESVEAEHRKELRAYAIEMAKRHMEQAKTLQKKAFTRLEELSPEELSPTELLRFLEVGMKLERETLGPPLEDISGDKVDPIGVKLGKELMERTERLLANRRVGGSIET
jgi:hypothetical protein